MNGTVESPIQGKNWRQPIAILGPSPERLAALGAWFATEHGPLVRFATIVCGDPHVAEDLVQEAFVRVYHAGGRAEGAIGAYARRAIVNLSRSGYRRRAAERRAYSRVAGRDEIAGPEADATWVALDALSPKQRAVIALRYYEDMSERDVATTLGMGLGTVKKHHARAMEHLRELLADRRTS